MPFSHGQRLGSVIFTVALSLLVGAALSEVATYFTALLLFGIGAGAFYFTIVFPGSRFFSISLANSLAVYACVFMFFLTVNFPTVDRLEASIGFALPIVAFFVGTFLRRREIATIVTARRLREERDFGRVFVWLVPVAAVGASTFVLPALALDHRTVDIVFIVAMASIALIVLLVSRDVSSFLIDTGLIFEAFFERVAALAVPAFAFLTFYSLNVIVFAAVYRIVDRVAAAPLFLVDGAPRDISFSDAVYFSLITVSTVGYGDITPAADTVRVIAAIQIVLGVLLLLFGFYEIIHYAREHQQRREHERQ